MLPHPSHKNENVARMGHLTLVSRPATGAPAPVFYTGLRRWEYSSRAERSVSGRDAKT
jgi:hypothetical protein